MDFLKNNYVKVPVFLYVLGFAVHNAYLSIYGSYEFELIQARYILSGIGFVGFVALSFSYMCIQINLSYLPDNLKPKKLFPWLLRLVSLPSIFYTYLHSFEGPITGNVDIETLALYIYISLGNFIVVMSLFNLIACLHHGDDIFAKLYRWFGYFFSIPMILLTFYVASQNEDLRDIFIVMMYFFAGFLGLALQQVDSKNGFEPDYLDSGAKSEHENRFQLLIGSIAIFLMIWSAITKYSEVIYPNIPTALGGSRLESATLYLDDDQYDVDVIQETKSWFLILNNNTGNVEKIKVSDINKIVYRRDELSSKAL
ncbi:TPA: hypothetical protein ACPHT3_004335 [Vibrio alginolyticus]